MKKTIITLALILAGSAVFADVEGPGTMKFSPIQINPLPPPAPVHLDAAQRILEGSPQPVYNSYGYYGNYMPINPNFGSRIYSPYGGYANIYHPGVY